MFTKLWCFAGFAFGLLVYSTLRVSYETSFLASYGNQLYDCASYLMLAINILFPLYALFLLMFIINCVDVVINVNQNLARIFLFHAIGTSLSLWVYTIILETTDAIAETDASAHGIYYYFSILISQTVFYRMPIYSTVKHHHRKANETFDFVYNDCGKSNALKAINRQYAPYLYPFVIEYCILLVAVCCKIYENIGHCTQQQQPSLERKPFHLPLPSVALCVKHQVDTRFHHNKLWRSVTGLLQGVFQLHLLFHGYELF